MNPPFTFRYARNTDFPDVLELARQLAHQIEAKAPPLTMARFVTYYVAPDAPMRLLLALDEGRTVGMIAWTLTHELYSAETRVYISDVSVDLAFRGKGVGTALMDEVKAWAQKHNATKLGWEVWHRNFSAQAFYEGLGATIDEEAVPYGLALGSESQ